MCITDICYSQLNIVVLFYLFKAPFLSILILTMYINNVHSVQHYRETWFFCQCNVRSVNERSTRCAVLPQINQNSHVLLTSSNTLF